MKIENIIRYTERAVGLKLSALQGEARLRGTRTPTVTLSTIGYRLSAIGYRLSATITPRLCAAKTACAGYSGLRIQRPSYFV